MWTERKSPSRYLTPRAVNSNRIERTLSRSILALTSLLHHFRLKTVIVYFLSLSLKKRRKRIPRVTTRFHKTRRFHSNGGFNETAARPGFFQRGTSAVSNGKLTRTTTRERLFSRSLGVRTDADMTTTATANKLAYAFRFYFTRIA